MVVQQVQAQQPTPAKKSMAAKGVIYRVQICTVSKKLKPGCKELQGIKDIHYAQSGRFFVYTAGNYTNLQEAQQRCNTIRKQTTFKDASVIAIYNGERITLERAAEIQKKK